MSLSGDRAVTLLPNHNLICVNYCVHMVTKEKKRAFFVDDSMQFDKIGEIMNMSHGTARKYFLEVMAKFIKAFAPQLPWETCLVLAKSPYAQRSVRRLLDLDIQQRSDERDSTRR